jgi:ankyrin repeat protein
MIDVYEQFLTAVVESDVKEVRRLIEIGLELNKRCDQGASALFGAILHGDPISIRLMLEHGADPNLLADEPAASVYTEKPLALARQARFLMDWEKFHPIVKLLEEYGATDSDGQVESDLDSKTVEIRACEWQARKVAQCR